MTRTLPGDDIRGYYAQPGVQLHALRCQRPREPRDAQAR